MAGDSLKNNHNINQEIMATTDFEMWLDGTDLSDFNDVYALYHSVAGIEDWGSYKTVRGRGVEQFIVTAADNDESLLLASNKARDTFLKKIEDDYCEGMDIEGYYGFHHAMEKDD